jgi:hypothetical protein
VPARPYGKSKLERSKKFRSEEGRDEKWSKVPLNSITTPS